MKQHLQPLLISRLLVSRLLVSRLLVSRLLVSSRPNLTRFQIFNRICSTMASASIKVTILACLAMLLTSGWLVAQAPDDATSAEYQRKNFKFEAYKKRIAAEYIYGFETIHFYMTLEEVKEKLDALELTKGVSVEEKDSDIYAFPKAIQHDFIFYHNIINKYYAFSILPEDMEVFLSKIIDKGLPTRIYHLSKVYKNDFKLLTIPASLEDNRPWTIKLTFFNRELNNTNAFRLFAISLTYHNENNTVGNFAEVPNALVKRVRKKIYEKYGSPQHKRSILAGANLEAEKFYETFTRFYAVDNYRYNIPFPGNYALAVQLGLSYVQVADKKGNFQISYVATDYLREILPDFTTSQQQYEDFDLNSGTTINF